jgi:GYF domain 2
MNKKFYYLEGKEQKGPFSIEELKAIGISPEILVWSEGMENWQKAKDVQELLDSLKKLPPPPPIFQEGKKIDESNNETVTQISVEDNNIKFWATLKICLSIFLGVCLIGTFCFINTENKKARLKSEISGRVNNIFNGRSVIIDGENYSVQGHLKNTDYNNSSSGKSKNELPTDLFFPWWQNEKLYTIFECSNGGFTIKKLSKVGEDSYDLEVTESGDMGYRKPQFSRGITGWSYNENGSGNIYGNVKSDRLPVQQYYNLAYEYYTKNDKTGTYSPGSLNDINRFINLNNEYFSIDNISPTKATSSNHFAISWKSLDSHSGGLTWDDAKLYYTLEGKHYEVVFIQDRYNYDLLVLFGIISGIFILTISVIIIAKPKFFRNLFLFGKKWRNISNQEHLVIFEHYFFKPNSFVQLWNNKVFKGVMKITDKGNTINLSYPDSERFYKIEKIDEDNLTIRNLEDGKTFLFERMGAKQNASTII